MFRFPRRERRRSEEIGFWINERQVDWCDAPRTPQVLRPRNVGESAWNRTSRRVWKRRVQGPVVYGLYVFSRQYFSIGR